MLIVFWQNYISAEFLYFGARFFYHLTTTVEQAPVLCELSTLNDVQHAGDMLDAVERDMKDLTLSRVGERKKIDWQADGYFTKLPVTDDRCVYVYNHKQYVTCSSVLLSHLNRMWFIIDQSGGGLVSCQEHQYHDDLQPFFMDNNFLLKYYEHAISMG